jgi:capsular polysaccharide biosynthesis protein
MILISTEIIKKPLKRKLYIELPSRNSITPFSNSNQSPWLLFLVAIVAIIVGVGILFIKKFLDKRKQVN